MTLEGIWDQMGGGEFDMSPDITETSANTVASQQNSINISNISSQAPATGFSLPAKNSIKEYFEITKTDHGDMRICILCKAENPAVTSWAPKDKGAYSLKTASSNLKAHLRNCHNLFESDSNTQQQHLQILQQHQQQISQVAASHGSETSAGVPGTVPAGIPLSMLPSFMTSMEIKPLAGDQYLNFKKWIISDLQSVSIVNCPMFKSYHESMGFVLPSQEVLTADIDNDYALMVSGLRSRLTGAEKVALAVDMYQHESYEPILLLTCHFVNSEYQRHHMLLDFDFIPTEYDENTISESLTKMIHHWGIQSNVISITSDSEADVLNAGVKLAIQQLADDDGNKFVHHISCFGTMIQRVGTNLLELGGPISTKIQALLEELQESTSVKAAFRKLREKHKLIDTDLEQSDEEASAPADWTDSYFLLERALKLKAPINEHLDEVGKGGITHTEWETARALTALVSPFASVTKEMAMGSYSNMALIRPTLAALTHHLVTFKDNAISGQKAFTDRMKKAHKILQEYYASAAEIMDIAFFLDPSAKDWNVPEPPSSPKLYSAYETAKSHFLSYYASVTLPDASSNSSESSPAPKKQRVSVTESFSRGDWTVESYLETRWGRFDGDVVDLWKSLSESGFEDKKLLKMVSHILPIPTLHTPCKPTAQELVMDTNKSHLEGLLLRKVVCLRAWQQLHCGCSGGVKTVE